MKQLQLTETQNKVVEEFDKLNPRRAVIQLPTAFGKTVIAIEILKKYNYNTVLVVTNTVQLKTQWIKELRNNEINFISNTEVVTIQSIYEKMYQNYDIIVIDEGHHVCSEKWLNLLKNNNFKSILILTAELPREDDRHLLLKQFGIRTISHKSYETGIKEKLISDFQIFNIGVQLTNEERLNLEKINSFIDRNFVTFTYNFLKVKTKSTTDYIASELLLAFQRRKEILNNAENKLDKVEEIIKSSKWTKGIIYCEYIDFADRLFNLLKDKIKCCIYHSKIKDKEKILQDFKENKYDFIISVKCLDEGMNIPDLDFEIIVSSSSQKRQTIQRIGRGLRYKENKIATIYNLYVENSKEEQWLKERLESFDKDKIFWK